jgi:hypothetical protein
MGGLWSTLISITGGVLFLLVQLTTLKEKINTNHEGSLSKWIKSVFFKWKK